MMHCGCSDLFFFPAQRRGRGPYLSRQHVFRLRRRDERRGLQQHSDVPQQLQLIVGPLPRGPAAQDDLSQSVSPPAILMIRFCR